MSYESMGTIDQNIILGQHFKNLLDLSNFATEFVNTKESKFYFQRI